MLIGALGCNLAWGIIDAVFYLMGTLSERGPALVPDSKEANEKPGAVPPRLTMHVDGSRSRMPYSGHFLVSLESTSGLSFRMVRMCRSRFRLSYSVSRGGPPR
jgi:hypothetical protein